VKRSEPRGLIQPRLEWLLILIPVSLFGDFVLHQKLMTFLTAAGAILPLAGLIGRSTEELAIHAGPRIGGLLNATFGNMTELIVAIFLIVKGELDVVKASLTGSILGNLLLVLGMSLFVGGMKREEQSFNARSAAINATSMTLAVIGLLMPALFLQSSGQHGLVQREVVSGAVAGILMALYVAALLFTLVTHVHLFRTPSSGEEARWTAKYALVMLLIATVLVAIESELLVGSLESAVESLGVSKFFIGLIVIPIVGNAAEHASAVTFAARNQLDVTLEITTGSSTQIALFVAPALVFISLAVGHPMDFVFTTFEIAAVGLATLIVTLISMDGKSNWLEGVQLLGAYVIMAVSFFFVRLS
jgi:Ca2+:H+ antiporter